MKISRENINQAFASFKGKRVLILGDVMIDAYLRGKVDRISPEAPVPVVSLFKRENMLGGAANVALNVKALGGEPVLCSVIGNDLRGDEFFKLLEQDDISAQGILLSNDRITTTKFRIIGNNFQMLRVDEEVDHDLSANDAAELLKAVTHLLKNTQIDVVVFQDYNKGVLTSGIISEVIEIAGHGNIPVVVDPKKKNFDAYKKVELFKPNLKELREGLKTEIDPSDVNSLRNGCNMFRRQSGVSSIMVTLSERGVYLNREVMGELQEVLIPAHVRHISDVSGAGDTVISVASLCVASKLGDFLMVSLANLAGGLVCEKVGVVPVDREKFFKEAMLLLVNE